jgi:hypothetical protein
MVEPMVVDRARFRRVALWASLAAAVALCWPSLGSGLQTEDLVHRSMSRSTTRWINLFGAGASQPGDVYAAKDSGELPWITADDFSLSLWRPLASATHHVDYRLWPDNPFVMHVQSVLWLLAAIVGASVLFRRLSSGSVAATLATAFYSVDDGHGFVVGWLANRNALVATAIAIPALIAHDRWRRDAWRPGGVVAGVLAWLALQGGELAIGAFGYAAAHIVFLDPARWRRRWVPLVPWAIAGLAWLIPYRIMGYGARGSGAYVDPLGAPRDFLLALGTRLPTLVWAELTGNAAERASFEPPGGLTIAILVTSLLAVASAGWVRRDPRARFWLFGMLLAAVPACGTFPADRLLVLASLGGMALAGELVAEALGFAELPDAAWRRVATTIAAILLLLSNGVAAISVLPGQSLGASSAQLDLTRLAATAYDGVEPGEDLIVVNGLDYYGMGLLSAIHAAAPNTPQTRTRVLYGGLDAVTVSRTGPNELLMTAPHSFVPPGQGRVYRGLSRPMRPGDHLQLTGMEYIVQRVDSDGMPAAVKFVFDSPLDDGTRIFKRWNGAVFLPFALPPVGESAVVGPGLG